MFLHESGDSGPTLAISQASHAWLAWQLAGHWGNRRFDRPLPRAEVLAAVMLHDSGWTDFDIAPGIDPEGRPRTFDRMEVATHLEIWRSSVERTALHSRFAALLVADHFGAMAELKSADLVRRGETASARLVDEFGTEMDRRQESWVASLGADPRYRDFLKGRRRRSSSEILTLADRVSVFFCASLASTFEISAPTADGELETVTMTAVDRTHWRVDPWPMEGQRARLQCEGRALPATRFDSVAHFHEVLRSSTVERLNFTLMRASAVG
jgi:hypothetical protein